MLRADNTSETSGSMARKNEKEAVEEQEASAAAISGAKLVSELANRK